MSILIGCGRMSIEQLPNKDGDTDVTNDTLPDTDTDNEATPYPYYRLQFDNAMTNCGGFNSLCVTRVNLRINGAWRNNDFSSCAGTFDPFAVDLRASSSFEQEPYPCEDPWYGPSLAFNNTNRCWGSGQNAVDAEPPYSTKEWLEMHFLDEPVTISCVKILGGERGFYNDCAPARFRVKGSYDGWTWYDIPGSERAENTDALVTYCFQPLDRPHEPHPFKSYFHGNRVNFTWEPGNGDEVGYLLVRGTSETTFVPMDGVSYPLGTVGADTVVFKGKEEAFSDTDVMNGTAYYYALYAYNSDNNYSAPAKISGTTKARQTRRYYRLVIDSTYGYEETPYSNAVLVSLELQIDGTWAQNYNFTSSTGTIDGKTVEVSASSVAGEYWGYNVFGDGQWRTKTGLFDLEVESDAVNANSVYLQFDFGSNPVAITGWRAKSTTEEPGYQRAPDGMHMQASKLGLTWDNIAGSYSKNLLWEEITQEWR